MVRENSKDDAKVVKFGFYHDDLTWLVRFNFFQSSLIINSVLNYLINIYIILLTVLFDELNLLIHLLSLSDVCSFWST